MTIVSAERDAAILEAAASVLKRRSRKPKSFLLGVAVRVLQEVAADIRAGKL